MGELPSDKADAVRMLGDMENPVPYLFCGLPCSSYSLFGCSYPDELVTSDLMDAFHITVAKYQKVLGVEYMPQMTLEFVLAYVALSEVSPNIYRQGISDVAKSIFFDLLFAYNFEPWSGDCYQQLLTLQNTIYMSFFMDTGFGITTAGPETVCVDFNSAYELNLIGVMKDLHTMSEHILKPTEAML